MDTKILIVNNDGHGGFFNGLYSSKQAIENDLEVFRGTHVKILEWCVTIGSKANYPSRVTEVIGEGIKRFPRRGDKKLAETLNRLISNGINPLNVVIKKCHELCLKIYPSIRMNPDYSPSWMGELFARMYNSKFWWENPDLRIKDKKGKILTKLSYAYPEVQRFKISIIKELLEYDIDGINLDFLRHPPFLGYDDPLIDKFKKEFGVSPLKLPENDIRWIHFKTKIMTDFIRKVRKLMDKSQKLKDKKLELSVRVDHRDYLKQGLDIKTWINEKLIDHLIVSEHSLGGFTFSLIPFKKMVENSSCKLYFGEEAVCSGHDLTPEEDRLLAQKIISIQDIARKRLSIHDYCKRALKWYREGADGIHIFNDPRNREIFLILGDPKKIRDILFS